MRMSVEVQAKIEELLEEGKKKVEGDIKAEDLLEEMIKINAKLDVLFWFKGMDTL